MAADRRREARALARSEARALAILVIGLVAIGSLPLLALGPPIDWPSRWLVAVLIGGATAFGAFHLFAREEPRGVPVETLVTPALTSVALYGAVPVAASLDVHPALALAVALAGGVFLLEIALEAEVPFVRLGVPSTAGDRRIVETLLMAAAFVLFTAVAATLPGEWARVEVDRPGEPLGEFAVATGLADAAVAFLVGYRLTLLAAPDAPAAGWAGGSYAVLLGIAAVVFRWLALPGLLGAALLTLVLHLRSIVPTAASPPDAAARWRLEALVAALVILLVVGYRLSGR